LATATGNAIVLSVRNLTKTYRSAGEPVEVLRGVDLDVAAGERVALTGESGSGKSTLLHLIAGLDKPDGGEIDLAGDSVSIATAVVLPSGKLVVNATNDITIGTGGRLDLSGQPTTIVDATVYGFGGDISLSSVQGNITQQAGSVIDVSATGNDAGSLTVSAIGTSGGRVSLGGELLGGSTPVAGDTTSHADGSFTVAAQTLASGDPANLSSDFAVLNQTLTNGGFFASRSFDLRQVRAGPGPQSWEILVRPLVSRDGGEYFRKREDSKGV